MNPLPRIQEMAHDPAAIVDPAGLGCCGSGEIDLGEGVIIQEKPVGAPTIKELADDLAAIIDPVGCDYARRIDLCEYATVEEKAVKYASGIGGGPHDLATIIETKDNRTQGPREIDLGEGQFILMAAALLFTAGFLVCKGDC
jgi:hypothetical protein